MVSPARLFTIAVVMVSICAFTVPASAQQSERLETVEYTSGALRLRGLVFRPDAIGRRPAVVFLHGAVGASDREAALIGNAFANQGYVLFFPFRRGLGLSVGQGEPINPRLAAEEKASGEAARMRMAAQLLSVEQFEDVRGAVDYVRSRPDVDASRIAIFGHSFGGILSVLAAARLPTIRAVVSAATAAQNWARGPELQQLLREAARNARVPVFFFQSGNDADLTPTHELAAEMRRAGKRHVRKLYPPYGHAVGQGHGIVFTAPEYWQNDVFGFLAQQLT